MIRSLLVLALSTSSIAFAYGSRSLENVVVKSVSCDYQPVVLNLRTGARDGGTKSYEALQNLAPMVVTANLITVSAQSGRKDLGRQVIPISLNGIEGAILSENATVTDQLPGLSPNGYSIQRTFVMKARDIRDLIIADRIASCRVFEKAQETGETLPAPLPIALKLEARVIVSPASLYGTSDVFATATNFVYTLPMGAALADTIRKNATCTHDIDGRGFSRVVRADGVPANSCN